MNKITFFFFASLLTLLFSCSTINIQKDTVYDSDEIIRWTDTTKLSWDDFTGETDANTNFDCDMIVLTPAKFIEPTFFDSAAVKIECFMVKNASWVVKSKAKKQLLAYNQTLFDIYELSTRKMRKKVSETNFKVQEPITLFNNLYNEHYGELAKTISQYRSETEDGEKTKKMMEWAEKVEQELNALEDYKNK